MRNICVIGSCSMDLVVTSDKRPKAGETVLGKSFQTVPGGKGANQAVAAARLGAQVFMVGKVGDDHYGTAILNNLKANGVRTDYMEPVTHTESGTAHIVLAEGDNSIVVVKGANDDITPAYALKALEQIEKVDMVLIQQEIPEETVDEVCKYCHSLDIPIMLNPAPARPLKQETIDHATYLTPNEHESRFYSLILPFLKLLRFIRQSSLLRKENKASAIQLAAKKCSSRPSLLSPLIQPEPVIRLTQHLPWPWLREKILKPHCGLPIERLPFLSVPSVPKAECRQEMK